MSLSQIILSALGFPMTKRDPNDGADVVHERAITGLAPSEYDGTEFPPEAVSNLFDHPQKRPDHK